jgi:DNA polymerase III epsilon subunit-like protein
MPPTKCGSCRKEGHNKNYCPLSDTTVTTLGDAGRVLFVVFDLETTGFSARKNSIIQLAAKLLVYECDEKNVKGEFQDTGLTFDNFVNPSPEEIPENITKLTGITFSDVKDSEIFELVFQKWSNWIQVHKSNLKCDKVVLAAHNADFDVRFLLSKVPGAVLETLADFVIDTMTICRGIGLECVKHRLKDVYNALFQSEIQNAHNALGDVNALSRVVMSDKFCTNLRDPTFCSAVHTRHMTQRLSLKPSLSENPLKRSVEEGGVSESTNKVAKIHE